VRTTSATVATDGPGARRTVRVTGEVDLANVDDVHHRVAEQITPGGCVTVDLGGLDYLDSSGVRMLDELLRRASGLHCEILFALPQNAVCRRVLELTLPGLPEPPSTDGAADS
jgi:anti-sigma B factor antagonist